MPSCSPPTGGGCAPRAAVGCWARSVRACWLRWFRQRGCVQCLANNADVSQATGHRYLHEGVDVLAEQAPDLHIVLDRCWQEGMTHVVLDGTLIQSDHLACVRENGNGLWFSQKHKAFGSNVQFLSTPDGTPLWVSDGEPGSVPDITAARIHALTACTRPPQTVCPPWATRPTPAPESASTYPSADRKASPNRPSTPTPEPRTP
ncbi:transposase family protein [Streptomyces chartreusis]